MLSTRVSSLAESAVGGGEQGEHGSPSHPLLLPPSPALKLTYLLDVPCSLSIFFLSFPLPPFSNFRVFLEADLPPFSICYACCWVEFGSSLCHPYPIDRPSPSPPRHMLHHLATQICQCPSHLLH